MKEQGKTLDEKTILDLLTDLVTESHYTRQFIERQEKVMAENERNNVARGEKLSAIINNFENKYKTI